MPKRLKYRQEKIPKGTLMPVEDGDLFRMNFFYRHRQTGMVGRQGWAFHIWLQETRPTTGMSSYGLCTSRLPIFGGFNYYLDLHGVFDYFILVFLLMLMAGQTDDIEYTHVTVSIETNVVWVDVPLPDWRNAGIEQTPQIAPADAPFTLNGPIYEIALNNYMHGLIVDKSACLITAVGLDLYTLGCDRPRDVPYRQRMDGFCFKKDESFYLNKTVTRMLRLATLDTQLVQPNFIPILTPVWLHEGAYRPAYYGVIV